MDRREFLQTSAGIAIGTTGQASLPVQRHTGFASRRPERPARETALRDLHLREHRYRQTVTSVVDAEPGSKTIRRSSFRLAMPKVGDELPRLEHLLCATGPATGVI